MRGRFESARPSTLLLVLLVTIPVLVIVAGGISVLLIRAGYGILVGLVVPSLALSGAVILLGTFLGRTASARRDTESGSRERKKSG